MIKMMYKEKELLQLFNDGEVNGNEILGFYSTSEGGTAAFNNAMEQFVNLNKDRDFDIEIEEIEGNDLDEMFELPDGTEIYPYDNIFVALKIVEEDDEDDEDDEILNAANPFIVETENYDSKYENKNVKFAKFDYGKYDNLIIENKTYGKDQVEVEWLNTVTGKKFIALVDANPTSIMAKVSHCEISKDGYNWEKVSDLAIIK